MPDPDSVIDPEIQNVTWPEGAATVATPARPPADDEPDIVERPSAARSFRDVVDEHFPEDPAAPAHHRPLADRVASVLRALAEVL